MTIDELAEALRAGEAAPEGVLGEDWDRPAGARRRAGRAGGASRRAGAGRPRGRGRAAAAPGPGRAARDVRGERWPRRRGAPSTDSAPRGCPCRSPSAPPRPCPCGSPASGGPLRLRQLARRDGPAGAARRTAVSRRRRAGRGDGLRRARAPLAQPVRDEPAAPGEARRGARRSNGSSRSRPRTAAASDRGGPAQPRHPHAVSARGRGRARAPRRRRRRPASRRPCHLPRTAMRPGGGECATARRAGARGLASARARAAAPRPPGGRAADQPAGADRRSSRRRRCVNASGRRSRSSSPSQRRRLYARRLWAVAPALERRGAEQCGPDGTGHRSPAVPRRRRDGPAVRRAALHQGAGADGPAPGRPGYAAARSRIARGGGSPAAGPEAPPGERRSPGGLILP